MKYRKDKVPPENTLKNGENYKVPMDFESKVASWVTMPLTESLPSHTLTERAIRDIDAAVRYILEAHREELVREFTDLLSDLPDAVFVPDDASNEAWAGGKGLSVYRLEVQKLLQDRIQALTRIKEEE